GVSPHEIYACVCDPELLPRGFETSRRPATVAALQELSREIARHAAPDDVLLFVATNHGDEILNVKGLTTDPSIEELDAQSLRDDEAEARPSPDPLLTPEALAACFDPLPGVQVLVVAACYAGCFLDIGARERRAVVTSCAADKKYRVGREESWCSPFLAE